MDYCSEINKNGHIHHLIKKANMKKKFFLKNFIIGLILLVLVCIIMMIFKDKMLSLGENMYNLSTYDCRRIYVGLKGIWFLFLVQFALVPFISCAMLEGCLRKEA